MPNENLTGGANGIIGPDSLLRHYTDMRIGFTGLSTGVLQLMHPDVSAGVIQHSTFFEAPWQRIFNSIPPILGVIHDPDPEATGREIRGYHKHVKGVNDHGERYHALDPETFWWTHAAFLYMAEQVIDRFSLNELTLDKREQLYAESKEWYRRYGVSERPQPATYAGFVEKWNHICRHVLEMTPAASHAIDIALSGHVDRLPGVPPVVWQFARLPVSDFVRVVTIGGLPAEVRQRFDLPFNDFDKFRLQTLEKAVRNGWRFLPASWRYHERARAGYRAAKAA